MRVGRLLIVLVLAAAAVPSAAQRPQPVIDPDSREGFLLQQILQESDPAAKLRLLEQFTAQFPRHQAVAWVYGQSLPLYMQAGQYQRVLAAGDRLLALDPADLDAAETCLKAAVSVKAPEAILKYAQQVWQIAGNRAQAPGVTPEVRDLANKAQRWAEFEAYSAASGISDRGKHGEMLLAAEQCCPQTAYRARIHLDLAQMFHDLSDPGEAIAFASQVLAKDPDNADLMFASAELRFRREEYDQVIPLAQRAAEIVDKEPRPESATPEAWRQRREQYLQGCYWMGGIASSIRERYKLADRLLRASLPYLKDKPPALAAAYLHLGLVNYKLAAQTNGGARARDALRFSELCLAIQSPYQAQAKQNIALIKSEYNLR